ncbi:hypothetical protein ACFOOK_03550 [Micromonospora krabiensis]|uniref:Uncharacterized protein n=1 Tax=Micromonospora krabiensis TaxID=307121 RepID=A0A1C3NED9_9ACTN|nr:hypothetical protein [Micromonospora krabiensis]SBV30930.1 hypothetical protein GA0070620_6537 [Micromonospora krabiensis]
MTAPPVPDVPEGTRLYLRAGEWRAGQGTPAAGYLDLRVLRVYGNPIGGRVWVRGHHIECVWPDGDCTAPWCVEAQVSVAAIRANVDGKQ